MSVFKLPQHLILAEKFIRETGILTRFVDDTFGTIEALRPVLRLVREERIIKVGSHVTSCTLCDTSWLTDKEGKLEYGEHHEKSCTLYGIPVWLAESEN
ncbi:MAG: hypothetical protein K940chlam2_01718 [Chlamydiae bacterium]|nr:hypothetical protein [Chlamydiota bacterium]